MAYVCQAAPQVLQLAPSPPQAHCAALPQLPCQVVACVPQDELTAAPWAPQEDSRRTAKFMSYALAAAAEASAEVHTSGVHPCC